MPFDRRIFRQYDIRGEVDLELDDELAADIGRAVSTYFLRQGTTLLSVGRDCRHSSPSLAKAFITGALETGIDIVDVGMVPTPALYFSVVRLGLEGGVMVTGSHHGPTVNGFKVAKGVATIFGDELMQIADLVAARDFERGQGTLTERDVFGLYCDDLAGRLHLGPRNLLVAIDGANGVGGPPMLEVLERLGVHHIALYCEPDGNFPNHEPDPIVESNIEDLIHEVKDQFADLGIAFDADADRIGVVDSTGEVIPADRLLMLFARDILKSHPGATIIGDVKCSQMLFDDINARGGRAIMWKTGHSLIKRKMIDEQALLAGEMSGHVFFAHRYYGYDDAIYAGLRLIELLSHTEDSLSELLEELPQVYATRELRLDSTDEEKFEIVERVREIFESDRPIVAIDGVRVQFDGGWGLLRASNTEPVVVFRCEATTAERLDEIVASMEDALAEAGLFPTGMYF
ncbi:MAG: phosphomannomutase/phosphoglucomutase [Myxococcales bacterium]|nr:phosphomannomutase/phosphoglucomutase [Myxococcales bacterium]